MESLPAAGRLGPGTLYEKELTEEREGEKITFPDGSTRVSKAQGTTTALASGESTFEGTFTFIKGTGRSEGIQGGGTYTGKRLAPLTPGGPADSYLDSIYTYTLPLPVVLPFSLHMEAGPAMALPLS